LIARNLRPFPKTITPLPDELLSSWVGRLASANYCDARELLQHVGIPDVSNSALDQDLPNVWVEALALAGRIQTNHIRKMALPKFDIHTNPFIATQPFQDCPSCRAAAGNEGFELRHWRFAWSLYCEKCGDRLTPLYLGRAAKEPVTKQLIQKAGQGAKVLARAVQTNNTKDLRRVQTALRFSTAYLCIHSPDSVLFSGNYYDRLFCLAAISEVQNYPLAKAAWLIANSSFTTRKRIYRTFENKRLLRQRFFNLGSKAEKFVNSKTLGARHSGDLSSIPISRSKTKYELASLQAIAELGYGADRKKLLRRADEILNAH